MRKFVIIQSLVIGVAATFILLQLGGFIVDRTELSRSCQPDLIKYQSEDPYCLVVVKERRIFTSAYVINIVPRNQPDHGHVLNFPNPYVIHEREVTDARIIWTDEGIELEAYLGTRLFIPKKNFTQSR